MGVLKKTVPWSTTSENYFFGHPSHMSGCTTLLSSPDFPFRMTDNQSKGGIREEMIIKANADILKKSSPIVPMTGDK